MSRHPLAHALRPHSHDAVDFVDAALESSARGIRAVKLSLVALGATAAAQLAVVAISGSVALLADTIHNFSDALTSLPLWFAFALGRRKPTRRYTYGYGRGVAAGWRAADPVVGLVITAAILAVLWTAVRDIFRRLMDAVDPDLVDAAEETLESLPGVVGVRRVRMRWIGHEIHADADLDIHRDTSLAEAHRLAHEAEHALTHSVPKLTAAVVHTYPEHDSG